MSVPKSNAKLSYPRALPYFCLFRRMHTDKNDTRTMAGEARPPSMELHKGGWSHDKRDDEDLQNCQLSNTSAYQTLQEQH